MAENASNDITYILQLDKIYQDYLGQIRHWDNLKMATEAAVIWIKGLTTSQLDHVELQSIPFIKIYECRDHVLFPKGSRLPKGKMPNLLWTPLEKALPIELTSLNHNFFGVQQTYTAKLIQSEAEQTASVLLVDISIADNYINTAAAIRLQSLQWTRTNKEQVLFFGTPFLPLNGTSFWQKDRFIFPLGFDLEFPILTSHIQNKISSTDYIWWTNPDHYALIPRDEIRNLSIASWRKTLKQE